MLFDGRIPRRPEHDRRQFVDEVAVDRAAPVEQRRHPTVGDERVAIEQIVVDERSRTRKGLGEFEHLRYPSLKLWSPWGESLNSCFHPCVREPG